MTNKILLSVSEAAKLFGINQRTVRRAIAARTLKSKITNSRYQISLQDLLKWSEDNNLIKKKRDTLGIGQFVSAWKK
jgi:excisionase family DNA binding protein